MDINKKKFWIDFVMFLDFVIMAISGFVLWFIYPAGDGSGRKGIIFLFDRFDWILIHNWASVLLILLIILHLSLNWKWIKTIFRNIFGR